jgi:hypothetical protein
LVRRGNLWKFGSEVKKLCQIKQIQYMCHYGKYRARCNFNKWEALLKVRAEIVGETQVFWLANRQEADLSRTPRQDVECSATAKTPVVNRTDFKPVLCEQSIY